MKLALYNDYRLGIILGDEVADVTAALPAHDSGYAANFWLRMCREFPALRPRIEEAAGTAPRLPLETVRLRAPVLNPSKVIAAASNYREHVAEMAGRPGVHDWLLAFDVFLKAPSSIIGPGDTLHLPQVGGREIHHESELALVIGKEGKDIAESRALEHVLGYTILIDVTLRGEGDRSRRKSYDGFTPVGPWLVTGDEIGDPQSLDIKLWVDGALRQSVNSREMMVKIPGIVSFASRIMTLYPGDVITTGAPPGVGEIRPGETMTVEIQGVGRMTIPVAALPVQAPPTSSPRPRA